MNISIIGAGPAGSRVAELLAKENEVMVWEEHEKPGFPEHCTGIVSPRLLEIVKTKSVLNKVKKVEIFGKKTKFSLNGAALVIDRQKFDEERFKAAKKAGASVFLGSRITFDGSSKSLRHGSVPIASDLIIAADGARSSVREYFHPHYSNEVVPSAQFLVSGKFDPKKVEIHMWPNYDNPGLFTWVVPLSGKLAKIGTACRDPKKVLVNFIGERFPEVKFRKAMAGAVLIGGPVRADFGRVKLVGDAAGPVKATTGGGLVPGLLCAEKLAESIRTGKNYHKLCRPVLNQLRLAHWLRFVWNRLKTPTKEEFLKSFAENSNELEKADMDWHSSSLIRAGLKELYLLPRVLFDLLI